MKKKPVPTPVREAPSKKIGHWSQIREAPLKFTHQYLGIAQIAIASPPLTEPGTLGHFFPGRFEQICQITVLTVHKCTKHPGKP